MSFLITPFYVHVCDFRLPDTMLLIKYIFAMCGQTKNDDSVLFLLVGCSDKYTNPG